MTNMVVTVDLTISLPATTRLHKAVTAEVAAQHGIQGKGGRYHVTLIEGDRQWDQLHSTGREAREYHYSRTLALATRGPRAIVPAMLPEYRATMADYAADMESIGKSIAARWHTLVDAQRSRLNGIFDYDLYPDTCKVLHSGLTMRVSAQGVPEGLREIAGAEDVATIEAGIKAQQATAMGDLYSRLAQRLDKVAAAAVGQRVHDSVISALHEVLDLAPALNLAGDPRLDALVEDARERLGRLTGDMIKAASPEQRQEISDTAKQFAATANQYAGML